MIGIYCNARVPFAITLMFRYNDHIDKQKTEKDKAQDRRFIRDHCISFTFVRDEFMPNPDFVFPQDHPGE